MVILRTHIHTHVHAHTQKKAKQIENSFLCPQITSTRLEAPAMTRVTSHMIHDSTVAVMTRMVSTATHPHRYSHWTSIANLQVVISRPYFCLSAQCFIFLLVFISRISMHSLYIKLIKRKGFLLMLLALLQARE